MLKHARFATPTGKPDPKHSPRGFSYKSYSFVEKDPIIFEIEEAIFRSGVKQSEIQRRSGVCSLTMRNWFTGPTRRPSTSAVRAVLRAIGADLVVSMPEQAQAKPPQRLKVFHGGKK